MRPLQMVEGTGRIAFVTERLIHPPARVVRAVAEVLGVNPQFVRAKDRGTATIAFARHVACYLLRELNGWSYPEIGRAIGRDHTTVLLGIRSLRERLDLGDDELADIVRRSIDRLAPPAILDLQSGDEMPPQLPTQENTRMEAPAVRRHLLDERVSITHKFQVGGYKGYIIVGLFDDGSPGEIFIRMAKEGSTMKGLLDGFSLAVSIALQYGVPPAKFCEKFVGTAFDPSGPTVNAAIPVAKSIFDYVFRYLIDKFPAVRCDYMEIVARQTGVPIVEEKTLIEECVPVAEEPAFVRCPGDGVHSCGHAAHEGPCAANAFAMHKCQCEGTAC